jgi:hypothetical protein
MSNFNHNLEFRDFNSLQTLLNMPRHVQSQDIEMQLILKEEAHLLKGFAKGLASTVHTWLFKPRRRMIARAQAHPRQATGSNLVPMSSVNLQNKKS